MATIYNRVQKFKLGETNQLVIKNKNQGVIKIKKLPLDYAVCVKINELKKKATERGLSRQDV